MYITEDEDEYDDQENTDIANEEDVVLMNDEENLSIIEENEEEYVSLNDDVESTGSEERNNLESEEHVSSNGRPVGKNAKSGVERLEISFNEKSYSHNTHWKLMMIRENYIVNEDVDTYQSLLHRVMLKKINAKKGIEIFV